MKKENPVLWLVATAGILAIYVGENPNKWWVGALFLAAVAAPAVVRWYQAAGRCDCGTESGHSSGCDHWGD